MTRRAYTPSDFCAAYGIGKTTFYAEVKAGRLHVRKVGRRTLVLASDAEQWADELPVMRRVGQKSKGDEAPI
jgi:hypothetical protein